MPEGVQLMTQVLMITGAIGLGLAVFLLIFHALFGRPGETSNIRNLLLGALMIVASLVILSLQEGM